MYEETALHINRMKKKEDIAMQTGNLLEKTTPNCRFMTSSMIMTSSLT